MAKNVSELRTYVDTQLATNGNNEITASVMRDVMSELLDTLTLDEALFIASDNTGVTDVTSELKAFITANPDKLIKIPTGVYNINSLDLPVIKLTAEPNTVTFVHDYNTPCIIHNHTATNHIPMQPISGFSSTLVSPLNRVRGSRITVPDASLFSAGDSVFIHSDDDILTYGFTMGESGIVVETDEANNYVFLDRPLIFEDTYATSPKIISRDQNNQLYVNNIKFSANGDVSDLSLTQRSPAIVAFGLDKPVITNCEFEGSWAESVIFYTCSSGILKNLKFSKLLDLDLNTGRANGHGLTLFGCFNFHVENVHCSDVRFGVSVGATQDNQNNYTEANWEKYGISTHNYFKDVKVTAAKSHGVHVGEGSSHSTFDSCRIDHGDAALASAAGFYDRSMNSRYLNHNHIGGETGIIFTATDFNRECKHEILGLNVSDMHTQGDYDRAVLINSQIDRNPLYKHEVYINDLFTTNVARPLQMDSGSKIRIGYACFENFRSLPMATDCQLVFDKLTLDYSRAKQGGTLQFISVSTDTGKTSKILGNEVQVIKGNASNRPSFLLSAGNSTGTKSYRIGKITEFNVSGVAETLVTDGDASFRINNEYVIRDNFFNVIQLTNASTTIDSRHHGKLLRQQLNAPLTLLLKNNNPVGFVITGVQTTSEDITMVPESGSTVVNSQGHTKTRTQNSAFTLMVINNTDGVSAEYLLTGDTK